jgi:hypothetical protein
VLRNNCVQFWLEIEDEILSVVAPTLEELFTRLTRRSTGVSLVQITEVLDDMVKTRHGRTHPCEQSGTLPS